MSIESTNPLLKNEAVPTAPQTPSTASNTWGSWVFSKLPFKNAATKSIDAAIEKVTNCVNQVKNAAINEVAKFKVVANSIVTKSTTKIKNAKRFVTSIRTCASILRNPTSAVIKIIKDLPKVNLTELMLKPGDKKRVPLKILCKLKSKTLKNLPGPLEKRINKVIRNATTPPLPPFNSDMVKKAEKKQAQIKGQIAAAKAAQIAFEENHSILTQFISPSYASEKRKLERELKKTDENLKQTENGVPIDTSKAGTVDKTILEVVKILLNQLSVEKNLGSLIQLFLRELTTVLASLQNINLVGSAKSIENDFIKGIARNINIDIEDFEESRKMAFKSNLEKIASTIAGKVGKKSSVISAIATTLISASLIEKIVDSVMEVLSEEILDQFFSSLASFESCKDLNGILESYEHLLQNGIQFGSVNIRFPKGASLTQDQYAALKDNIHLLIQLILRHFTCVLVDGLANYFNWNSGASTLSQAASDREMKAIQRDVNKNFTHLIDEIQITINHAFDGIIGEAIEFRYGSLEFSQAISKLFAFLILSTFLTAMGSLTIGGNSELGRGLVLTGILGGIGGAISTNGEFVRERVSKTARGTASMALNLLGYEVKSIDFKQIILEIAKILRETAST